MLGRSDSVTNQQYGYKNTELLNQLSFESALKILENPNMSKYVSAKDMDDMAIASAVMVKYTNAKLYQMMTGKTMNLEDEFIHQLYYEVLEEKERQEKAAEKSSEEKERQEKAEEKERQEKEKIQKEIENIQYEKTELQQVAESLQSNSQGRGK